MFGRSETQSHQRYFLLHRAPDAAGNPYAFATVPKAFEEAYQGHGHTYHNWDTPVFEVGPGPLADIIGNDMFAPLVSPVVREVVQQAKGLRDEVHWLPVQLMRGGQDLGTYYLLHLPYRYKVLVVKHEVLTTTGELGKRAPLSLSALDHHQVFTYLTEVPALRFDVVVSERVRNAMLDADLTGIGFEVLEVSDEPPLSTLRPTNKRGNTRPKRTLFKRSA